MSDLNKKSDSGLNIDKIVNFCKTNVKYISAGVLTVALIVILAVTAVNNKNGEEKVSGKAETQQEDTAQKEETENGADSEAGDEKTESNPEIEKLLSTYYNSYAAGDVDKLSEITKSLSDMEKDYIKMLNEYVESYSNVSCTNTEGKNEGSYIVSVVYDMKFAGVEESLPGMNVFYVQTDKEGKLYINNLYSSFNRELGEQKTKKNIVSLIEEFENSDGIQKLQKEVQDEYDKIMDKNEDLQKKVGEVGEAITKWKDSYVAEDKKEEQQETPAEDQQEEPQQEETQENTDNGAADEGNTDNAAADEENTDAAADDGNTDAAADDGNAGGLSYVPEGTVLTATDGYNVRVSMGETAELVGTTAVGDSIKVVLSYAEGWTKVEWNGKTGYIKTELLLNN